MCNIATDQQFLWRNTFREGKAHILRIAFSMVNINKFHALVQLSCENFLHFLLQCPVTNILMASVF